MVELRILSLLFCTVEECNLEMLGGAELRIQTVTNKPRVLLVAMIFSNVYLLRVLKISMQSNNIHHHCYCNEVARRIEYHACAKESYRFKKSTSSFINNKFIQMTLCALAEKKLDALGSDEMSKLRYF